MPATDPVHSTLSGTKLSDAGIATLHEICNYLKHLESITTDNLLREYGKLSDHKTAINDNYLFVPQFLTIGERAWADKEKDWVESGGHDLLLSRAGAQMEVIRDMVVDMIDEMLKEIGEGVTTGAWVHTPSKDVVERMKGVSTGGRFRKH